MALPPSILVIDDDPYLREALVESLSMVGYRVRSATDGSEGLALVDAELPSVVVTDIHMPGIGGAAVIAKLRRDHPLLPIVAISGQFTSGSGLDADGALALGATRALNKPFMGRDLLKTVAEILSAASDAPRASS